MTHQAQATNSADVSDLVTARRIPNWMAPAILLVIAAVGLALRVTGVRSRPYIVDEGFSLLAAQTVAERGIPLLPSGVLYLHGTVQSYILAPLIASGLDPLDDLFVLRLVSAFAGVAAILLSYSLARVIGSAPATSLLAAAFIAFDPASVLWSGYVRMYSLAQPLALGVALLFLKATSDVSPDTRPGRQRMVTLAALVLIFWLAVFTHLAAALLWPAMAAAAIVIFGKAMLSNRRDLLVALGLCVLAPVTLIGLTGAIGPGAGTSIAGRAEGLPGVSFLGEDNVNLAQVLQPDPGSWTQLFAGGPLALLAPLLLSLASGILIGRFLLAGTLPDPAGLRRSTGILLALYWLPILILALFATDAAERYAVFLLPIGYVLVALATQTIVAPAQGLAASGWAVAGGVALAALLLLHGMVGSAKIVTSDLRAVPVEPAERYVAAHHQPGELILTSVSVDSTLRLGHLPELRYLPGGEGSQRSLRYTRFTDDGKAIDYWIGMPSLHTTDALCSALESSPGSWIMVSDRIWQDWGFNDLPPRQMERRAAAMRELVLGIADREYEDAESIVLRTRPIDNWSDDALSTCNKDTARPTRGNRQSPRELHATPTP